MMSPIKTLFAMPALVLAAAVPMTAQAAEVQIAAQGPVVELTVNEIVYSAPDVAQIGAGVITRAATAQQAVQQNAQAMERLVERMRALGIERRDIQTSNFNLNPDYRHNPQTGEQSFSGYTVHNQVSVKLRKLARAGEVLDALVAAGANNIHGPNFMLEDDAASRGEARTAAFASGKAMAENYARMAGYSGVRLLEVSESFQAYMRPPPPMAMMARGESSMDASTPIEPGEVGTGVTIMVKYEMVR